MTWTLDCVRKADRRRHHADFVNSHKAVRDGGLHTEGRVKLRYPDGVTSTSIVAGLARDSGFSAYSAPAAPEHEFDESDTTTSSKATPERADDEQVTKDENNDDNNVDNYKCDNDNNIDDVDINRDECRE